MWRSKVIANDLCLIFTFNKHNYKSFNNVVQLTIVLLNVYMHALMLIVYNVYLCCIICRVDVYLFINLFEVGGINVFGS